MQFPDHIKTERLVLRRPRACDLDAYRAYCASERSRFVGGPYGAEAAFDKLAAMVGHWELRGFGRYVITLNGRSVGHVGLLAMSDKEPPEMTWTLWSSDVEKNGYATEAVRAVLDEIDAHHPALTKFMIRIAPENAPSRRLAERIGAKLCATTAPAWMPHAVTYCLEHELCT